ncbi:MAG: lipid-A-disaccharide synthase [Pseudomonadota bacterium]
MPIKNVLIVAGEASGDMHGAKMVQAIKSIDHEVHFWGIGGPRMREAGVNTVFDAGRLAVVGISEVLTHIRQIIHAQNLMRSLMEEKKPDLLILIDYPDFNLLLAGRAKKLNLPVLYFISPQVWAWRAGRVNKIKELVKRMIVILPFEVEFYRRYDVKVDFVGHPLLDIVKPKMTPEEFREEFGLDSNMPVIGLFPGSRTQEVKRLLPCIIDAARILDRKMPGLRFLLPLAPAIDKTWVKGILQSEKLDIRILDGYAYEAMSVSRAIIAASGTVTLEAAIIGVPMVIVYKVSNLSYLVGKLLVDVPHIGLVNLVAGERIVPELVQGEARGERIAEEIYRISTDLEYETAIKRGLAAVQKNLGAPGASIRAAMIACEMLRD